jgi:hypothetical protein
MVTVSVDKAIEKMKKNFSQLSEKEITAGVAAAINRAVKHGVTEGYKDIKGSYNLNQATLAGSLLPETAKSYLLIGKIKASSKSISLSHFQPSFSFSKRSITKYSKKGVGVTKLLKGQSKTYSKGVTIEIIKGQRKNIPYAFMIAGKAPIFARGVYKSGGSYAFMQRHKRINTTGLDTPISSLVRLSTYSTLVNRRVMPSISLKINDMFNKRIDAEFNYRLNKMQL